MCFRIGGSEMNSFENDMGIHTKNIYYFEVKEQERIVFERISRMNNLADVTRFVKSLEDP